MVSTGFRVKERTEFNQYWYSPKTIEAITSELKSVSGPIAFLSTPSLFFSANLPDSVLFDFDASLGNTIPDSFVQYDYRDLSTIPEKFLNIFSAIVVDPPFITAEVWRAYASAAAVLWQASGPRLFLGTTVLENAGLMRDLFGASECLFKPSIPNLVYQYSLFTNFEMTGVLAGNNAEIPCD